MGRAIRRANTTCIDPLMKFLGTGIVGAQLIELEPHVDSRGFLARSWSHVDFQSQGLNTNLSECSLSFNRFRGTLRGTARFVRSG